MLSDMGSDGLGSSRRRDVAVSGLRVRVDDDVLWCTLDEDVDDCTCTSLSVECFLSGCLCLEGHVRLLGSPSFTLLESSSAGLDGRLDLEIEDSLWIPLSTLTHGLTLCSFSLPQVCLSSFWFLSSLFSFPCWGCPWFTPVWVLVGGCSVLGFDFELR